VKQVYADIFYIFHRFLYKDQFSIYLHDFYCKYDFIENNWIFLIDIYNSTVCHYFLINYFQMYYDIVIIIIYIN
jgi:hypothetical protein